MYPDTIRPIYSNRTVKVLLQYMVRLCPADLNLDYLHECTNNSHLLLSAMVTSACREYPTATPMPLASITTSKLSSPSTIVSFTIGMDTVTSVSPGKIVTLIGVLSKSLTIEE